MSGKLYIVPTPIGNLGDMTFRSVEVLKSVDLILAEDTRTSGVLLQHYEIATPAKSYHIHNEHSLLPKLIQELKSGKEMAQISDAGTPGISDPGFLLIREVVKENISLEVLPGANAVLPALLLSAFPCDEFLFVGFLPKKKGRTKKLSALKEESRTIIFYESPHKLLRTLEDLIQYFGAEREVSISREITKIFEETIRGSLDEAKAHFELNAPKGEFVIVLNGY